MKFLKLITLGSAAFVVTFLGLNISESKTFGIDHAVYTSTQSDTALASAACIPQNDENEIFFLSCGGVF